MFANHISHKVSIEIDKESKLLNIKKKQIT